MGDRAVMTSEREFLLGVHERLAAHYDLDRWHWQDDTPPLDVCVGAILVQHTRGTNVETAIANLRAADAMSLEAIAGMAPEELALRVRPAGTPMTKALRLQAFVSVVEAHGGFEGLFRLSDDELRVILLAT